jgi:ABC-type amino acid transport substrate-binding protein
MHLLSKLLLFLLSSFVLNATAVEATIKKVDFEFAAIEHLVEQEVGKIVLSAIYQELGININISSFSGNRAQYAANSGQKAGEIMRIWSYGTENENLIRVPTPYYSLITSAFIRKNSAFNINKASDLTGHKIARIRGVKHTNNISKNMPNVSDSSSTKRMLKLLHQGSVDVALTNYIDGLHVLRKLKLENEIISGKPLAELNLYHYLHKDHQYLVSKVDQMIIQLKANGKLAEMIKSAEQAVLNQ